VFIIPLCRDMIAADFVIVCVSCSWWLIQHFLNLTHQGTNAKHTDSNCETADYSLELKQQPVS